MYLALLLSVLIPLTSGQCPQPPSNCLSVFTHTPSHLPKCYCVRSICPDSLSRVRITCGSNQLIEDECGVCLECARARGQSCGGNRNREGEQWGCLQYLSVQIIYNVLQSFTINTKYEKIDLESKIQ